ELFEKLDRTGSLLAAYVQIGTIYTNSGQFEKAQTSFARPEDLYTQLSSPQIHVYKHLQRNLQYYYMKIGNWEAAYKHLKSEMQATMEFEGILRDSVVYRLRTEFETEKKEAQLAAQQEEIALQRKYARLERDRNNFLLAGLALSLLFIAVLYRMYHSNRKLSNRNAHHVREQGHRIRNHLQMISNMLQLNSDMLGDPEVKATLVESELRIQSVALLQKGLYG